MAAIGDSSSARVLEDPFLLAEVLVRIRSTRALARSRAVHPSWRAATAEPDFLGMYLQRHVPAHIGLVVQFMSVLGPSYELFDASQSVETSAALTALIDVPSLLNERVVGSRSGFVLTARLLPQPGYFVGSPCDGGGAFFSVAPPLPPIPRLPNQHTANTYDQFGFIPDAGAGGMAFFEQDVAGAWMRTCEGLSFSSQDPVHVHVSIFSGGQWVRYFSPAIPPRERVVFHTSPYYILSGPLLFMICVVGYIVMFDTRVQSFTYIPMPGELYETARSEMQYSVGEHSMGEITIVFIHLGSLHTWYLAPSHGRLVWRFVSTVAMPTLFIDHFGMGFWPAFLPALAGPVAEIEFHAIQPRAVSLNGRFVLMTVGVNHGLFVMDSESSTIMAVDQIDPDGALGHVFCLSEPWPPMVVL